MSKLVELLKLWHPANLRAGQGMRLSDQEFTEVVKNTPLIAVDFICTYTDQVLLGKRTNQPAQGYWFVPGGRVRKNETLDKARARVFRGETGNKLACIPKLLGEFEHFYKESMYDENVETHYVVLAYRIKLGKFNTKNDKQHEEFRWWDYREAIENPLVHPYTKSYIKRIYPI